MNEGAILPPHLRALAPLLAGQPQAMRDAYEYYVCLLLVQRQEMTLVETWQDGRQELLRFAAADGESYVVPRMALSRGTEAAIMANLNRILGAAG